MHKAHWQLEIASICQWKWTWKWSD